MTTPRRAKRRPATPNRRQSREAAFQLLFAMQQGATADRAALVTHLGAVEREESVGAFPQDEFSSRLLDVVDTNADAIEAALGKALTGWTLDRVAAPDRAILRLGIAEILFCADIPNAVSINEYIELSKEYGDEESPRFVNGVLDRVSRDATAAKPKE